jgi:hypothetical protein
VCKITASIFNQCRNSPEKPPLFLVPCFLPASIMLNMR